MLRHHFVLAAFVAALVGLAPTANAGLEFCFEFPGCDDDDPCTCDFEDSNGECVNDPRTRWASAARASGIQADLGGETVIPPTPDSNVKNPDVLVDIPADPAAHVSLLEVEELEENPNANTE
ncbi:MAG: hypothetical protein ACREQY_15165, partial [Candidatus Binatia bacterium]